MVFVPLEPANSKEGIRVDEEEEKRKEGKRREEGNEV